MQVKAHAAAAYGGDFSDTPSAPPSEVVDRMGEAARKALQRATQAVTRYGWMSFWVQLTMSVVSGLVLLFSVAMTSPVRLLALVFGWDV